MPLNMADLMNFLSKNSLAPMGETGMSPGGMSVQTPEGRGMSIPGGGAMGRGAPAPAQVMRRQAPSVASAPSPTPERGGGRGGFFSAWDNPNDRKELLMRLGSGMMANSRGKSVAESFGTSMNDYMGYRDKQQQEDDEMGYKNKNLDLDEAYRQKSLGIDSDYKNRSLGLEREKIDIDRKKAEALQDPRERLRQTLYTQLMKNYDPMMEGESPLTDQVSTVDQIINQAFNGSTRPSSPSMGGGPTQAAIDHLRQNPASAPFFEQKYGVRASSYLNE